MNGGSYETGYSSGDSKSQCVAKTAGTKRQVIPDFGNGIEPFGSRSEPCQDFERAFCEVTQFALRLSSPKNPSIACNGQVNGRQFSSATDVPVRLGDKIIGLLQIGRPALEAARAEHSKDSEKPIRVAGESMAFDRIPHTSINSAGPSRSRYEAIVHLLELFANQLSFFANEILIQQAEREPYRVRMARAFILSRQTEDFSLSDVARAIHVSPFYLCKIFKKATGLTFYRVSESA
jgi:hypothetical protein